MSKFQVGEVAIIAYSAYPNEFPVGSEVTILRVEDDPDLQYWVDVWRGQRVYANDQCLKKRQDPGERQALGNWDECPWRPAREVVT